MPSLSVGQATTSIHSLIPSRSTSRAKTRLARSPGDSPDPTPAMASIESSASCGSEMRKVWPRSGLNLNEKVRPAPTPRFLSTATPTRSRSPGHVGFTGSARRTGPAPSRHRGPRRPRTAPLRKRHERRCAWDAPCSKRPGASNAAKRREIFEVASFEVVAERYACATSPPAHRSGARVGALDPGR